MGDEKRRKPAPKNEDGSLIDPDSFWSEVGEESTEDVVTAPNLAAPPPGFGAEEDDEVAVVGLDTISAATGALPPRPSGPPPGPRPRPPAAVRQPDAAGAQARPRPARPARPAPFEPPPTARPLPSAAPTPSAQGDVEAVLITSERSLARTLSLILAVTVVSAFLGWFLIGRHAGEEEGVAEQPEPVSDEAAARGERPQDKEPSPADRDPTLVQPQAIAAKASIRIKSDPAEATVFIDDDQRGLTPTLISDLAAAGELTIRLEKDGYKPWIQTIELDAADPDREIDAGLVKISACKGGTGYLYITTKPAGATVAIDGKRLPGKTPQVINDVCATQSLEVLVQAAGRRAWKERVVLEEGEIRNLNLVLEK